MSNSDGFSPIFGKCTYWRELMKPEDLYDIDIKKPDRRVNCSCFVEGLAWEFTMGSLPKDCPVRHSCRYYVMA